MPEDKQSILKIVEAFLEDYTQELEENIADIIEKILTQKLGDYENLIKEKAVKGDKPILDVDYTIPKPIPGLPGYTPVKGKDYFDGKNADETKIIMEVLSRIPPSNPGPPGKDGTKIEGEQIVDKINELPTDDPKKKIDAIHIKNLPKYDKIGGVIRGGMEQIRPVNLTAQCDGVTTSFTLDRDAVAIILLVSMQAPGIYNPATHFTFTAPRTIALTSEVNAPEAGQSLIAVVQSQ